MEGETIRDEISRRREQMMKLHRAQTAPAKPPTVLSPFAASILGMEGTLERVQSQPASTGPIEAPATVVNMPQVPAPRASRRAQSHYNTFQTICMPATDSAPSYAAAMRQKQPTRRPNDCGNEVLPSYSCTVSAEGQLNFRVETLSPLENASTPTEAPWSQAYVVVRGTMLSLFKLRDGKQGRPIISYTLQHAEVGLATDTAHTVLVPQSRAAGLIPSSFRQKIWKKDPHLFRADRQTVLRVRVEAHQLVFADPSEDRIIQFMNAISAGIDLAPSLDERSIPRQCTVPRRRRRPRAQVSDDLNNLNLVAEQERILQQMYPSFAQRTAEQQSNITEPSTTSQPAPPSTVPDAPTSPSREEDEIDFSAMREDGSDNASSSNSAQLTPDTTNAGSIRPAVSRTTTASTVNSTWNDDMMYETAPTNFDPDGKWRPPHTRTEAQVQRYVRRCLPVLHAEAVRASDVLIDKGQRVKINWRSQLVEPWELQPPTYKSHGFDKVKDNAVSKETNTTAPALERTPSSASSSCVQDVVLTPGSSRSNLDDDIMPVDVQLASHELTKTITVDGDKGKKSTRAQASQQEQLKVQEVQRDNAATDVHGVVFCF